MGGFEASAGAVGGWQVGHQQAVRPRKVSRARPLRQRGQEPPLFQRWVMSQLGGGSDQSTAIVCIDFWQMARRVLRRAAGSTVPEGVAGCRWS